MKKISSITLLLLTFIPVLANTGKLVGKVVDSETGEGIIGTTIQIKGTTDGTITDWDGNYTLTLEQNTYSLIFSSISYSSTEKEVSIITNEITNLNVTLTPDLVELESIVVQGQTVKDSETSMLTIQRKSTNVLDGLSSQTFSKNGDSNLSSAITRIPGVSISGGKYIFVRGLGDRYIKTTLNGLEIPGLDPDRNSIQIDIFPTSILENITVYKTFSPDLFGDFSGGLVSIETKSFPEEKILQVSLGISGILRQTFSRGYLTYQGGKTDWLGFDDGTRARPISRVTKIPSEVLQDSKLEYITRSFNPTMSSKTKQLLPNGSLGIVFGNQKKIRYTTIGYNTVLNYQNTSTYLNNIENNRYSIDPDYKILGLNLDETRNGSQGQNVVLWSGLINTSVKKGNNQLTLNFLKIQNGESTSLQRLSINYNETNASLVENILTYTQRSITNLKVGGDHSLGKFKIKWTNSINWSRVYDPDFRETKVSITGGDTTLQVGDGAGIDRFYRDLKEFNESIKLDVTREISNSFKIKAGIYSTFKRRDFQVDNYLFRTRLVSNVSTDPNSFFSKENIWTVEERKGTFVMGNYQAPNNYNANQNILAGYLMNELNIIPQFKIITGVRVENNKMWYSGETIGGSIVYKNEKTLDKINILPSLALIQTLNKNTNIRLSYNRTLARPSFREKSIAQVYDPISKKTFFGNIDLITTDIDNLDLRLEHFPGNDEILSISWFYKKFTSPIEYTLFPFDSDAIKPRNAGDSRVYGLELEVKKTISNFSIGSNTSVMKSILDMKSLQIDNNGKTEYELRSENLRDGEILPNSRSMAGQAPFLINSYINYTDRVSSMNFNLSYNIQGKTLLIVGSGLTPDVYVKPFNSLNFNSFKSFGKSDNLKLTLTIKNILNSKTSSIFVNYEDAAVSQTQLPGVNFNIKFGLEF